MRPVVGTVELTGGVAVRECPENHDIDAVAHVLVQTLPHRFDEGARAAGVVTQGFDHGDRGALDAEGKVLSGTHAHDPEVS